MELIFLGTGTSQGVPLIAQPDMDLDLRNPKNWRTRSSVHVEMDGMHIQVDAGQEFRLQCIRENIVKMDYFILTHEHADHLMGMDDLRRFCDLREGRALPVYSMPHVLERIKLIYPYAICEKPIVKGYPAFELREMPKHLEFEGGTVDTVRLPHGDFEVLGLVFTEKSSGRRIAYYTDCSDVPPEARILAETADIVVLDALRPQPHPSHMHVDKAIEVAQSIGAPETYFTHMTGYIDHDRDNAKLPPHIHYAWDGLRLTL